MCSHHCSTLPSQPRLQKKENLVISGERGCGIAMGSVTGHKLSTKGPTSSSTSVIPPPRLKYGTPYMRLDVSDKATCRGSATRASSHSGRYVQPALRNVRLIRC